MNQREFEKLVEEAKFKAQQKLQEGFMEWLGNRAFRGEGLEDGEEEPAENQAQVTQV